VHVFDQAGNEMQSHARTEVVDNARWTDLDLGSGQTAAIVRKGP